MTDTAVDVQQLLLFLGNVHFYPRPPSPAMFQPPEGHQRAYKVAWPGDTGVPASPGRHCGHLGALEAGFEYKKNIG